MTTPLTPDELAAALNATLANLTAERDTAVAEVTSARDAVATAQADVARLTAELDAARRVGSAGIDISALTADLATAQVAAARAEATVEAYEARLDALNARLSDAEDDISAERDRVEAERTRREAVAQDLADQRVNAATQNGVALVEAERLRGENNLVVERSRQRWSWWAVLLACLIAGILGYLVHALCVPCNKVPVVPAKVDPVVQIEPAPVQTTSGRTISIGVAPVGNNGCCGQ
jgi:hypothetical protein